MMKQLTTYLNILLIQHDCVILPNIGGFMARIEEAQIDRNYHTIAAPQRVIGFNPSLTHNDGLLCEAYMQDLHISFEEASQRINEHIHTIITALNQGETVDLGALGHIDKQGETILFTSKPSKAINHPFYGLANLSLTPLSKRQELNEPTEMHNADTLYIPINKRLLKIGTAAASIVLAVVLVLTQADFSTQQSRQQAGFLTSQATNFTEALASTTAQPQAEQVVTIETKTIAPSSTTSGVYYTIIDCMSSAFGASKRVAELKAQGYSQAGFIELYGKIGIYTEIHTSLAESNEHLPSTRKTIEPTSWIYCAK